MTVDTGEETVAALLRGAVDLHAGAPASAGQAPDLLDIARAAEAAGLRALMVMDRHFSPAPIVQTLRRHEFAGSPLELLSGLELNNTVGGLNPYAVEHELMLGGRLVSMPTVSAANYIRHASRRSGATRPAQPALEVLDAWGRLRDEVKEILDIVAAHDAVLSTGHLHISEIWPLLEEARQRGVSRLLVRHSSFLIDAGLADMRELAGMGAFIEQCADMSIDCLGGHARADELMAFITAATVRQTILVPKLGRIRQAQPVERHRATIRSCLELGYSQTEIRQMISENALRLLGLAPRDGARP